jgi:N-acetylmuramoyl-L-alanine amidase
MARLLILVVAALLAAACASAPERIGAPSASWLPSPNFDDRRPQFVIIHHTSNETAEQALAVLRDPVREVSAHYLVGRDGRVYQLVDERKRAWHAGASRWGGDADVNSSSIGIEMDNDGMEPYPEPQIASLLALLADIQARYKIPRANFLAHGDVAPTRKVDPGRYFPWKTLADHGFGLWCDAPPAEVPPGFDTTLAMQALGYDVTDLRAAVAAFGRHYLATDDEGPELSERDKAVLACLVAEARLPAP